MKKLTGCRLDVMVGKAFYWDTSTKSTVKILKLNRTKSEGLAHYEKSWNQSARVHSLKYYKS